MPAWLWACLASLAACGAALAFVPTHPRAPYKFITPDHPIDMTLDKGGKWYYYFIGKPSKDEFADTVRKELLPLGFAESTADRPWYRFTHGPNEVIVCAHDEIATGVGGIQHAKRPTGTPRSPSTVLWIREPGGSTPEMLMFQVKKLALRW